MREGEGEGRREGWRVRETETGRKGEAGRHREREREEGSIYPEIEDSTRQDTCGLSVHILSKMTQAANCNHD